MHCIALFLGLLGLVDPALVATLAPMTGLPVADVEKALRGEIAVRSETVTSASGKSSGRGVGAVLIGKPIADCWAVVSRYEDKAEYQPRIKKVTVLDKSPERLHVKMEVDASVMTARYTGWFALDAARHSVHWTLDHAAPDNNITDVDGGYQLFEVGPGDTLLVYRTWVDSGRSVPRFIQDYMAKKSIPDLLGAIKKRIESGGTYHK